MIRIEDFKPITLENKATLEKYFRRYPQYHSENSIVTILSWTHYSPCRYLEYKDHLILECTVDGARGYHAPIGTPDKDLLEELLHFVKQENATLEIYDEENKNLLQTLHPEIPINENRGYFEYNYKAHDLAELKGKKYLNIRGAINTFAARWSYHTEPITSVNLDEVKKLVTEWSEAKHCEANEIMREEIAAVFYSLDHFDELSLEGIAIRIDEDDKLAAIAVWEIQNSTTALIHYEKGLVQYPGVYKIINRETARTLESRITWINREGDVDVAGLREAKLRYHPEFFVKAYYVLAEDIS